MAAVDLSDLVVEVLHNRGDDNHPDWSVGSGFFVGRRLVLTAWHNVDGAGELLVRVHGTEEHPAVVCLQGDEDKVDLAVLEVPDMIVNVPPLRYGEVDRRVAKEVKECWAVGYPKYKMLEHERGKPKPPPTSAQVNGEIPTGNYLGQQLLTLQVRNSPRSQPQGSEWAGMSGAVVFSGDYVVAGVITAHHLSEGESALTIVPIAAVDLLPEDEAAKWWKLLGVDRQSLVRLPIDEASSLSRSVSGSRLTLAKNLKILRLGDDAAADFPYIEEPIQDSYNRAIQTLKDATEEKCAKLGILVWGESNAGKTRLALESLKKALPEWPVLRWDRRFEWRAETSAEVFSKTQPFVLFIDDLQDYLPDYSDHGQSIALDATEELGTFLEGLLQAKQPIVVVATCRSDAEPRAKASRSLEWLSRLEEIRIRSFPVDKNTSEVKQIIDEFQKKDTTDTVIHPDDWDGTLGSLVLGLSRKQSQYLSLAGGHDPAAVILKAMKLLKEARTMVHNKKRLRAICAEVFGEKALQQDEKTWRAAVELLKVRQFVTADLYEEDPSQITLTIRQDAYFEKVVTDYRLADIKLDFGQLQTVLLELNDLQALTDLSVKLSLLKRDKEALDAMDYVLGKKPTFANLWYLKGLVLYDQRRPQEALEAFDHVNHLADGELWFSKGLALYPLKRYEEALTAFNQALALLDPASSFAVDVRFHKGLALYALERFEEAIEAFDQTLAIDPGNFHAADARELKDDALRRHWTKIFIDEHEEALKESDYTLPVDPVSNKFYLEGCFLVLSEQFEQAIDAFNHVLSIYPNDSLALFSLGHAFLGLAKIEEAMQIYYRLQTIDPPRAKRLLRTIDQAEERAEEMLFEVLQKLFDKMAAIQAESEDQDKNE